MRFDYYKAVFRRFEINNQIVSDSFNSKDIIDHINNNLFLLNRGPENDLYNREKAHNYRYEMILSTLDSTVKYNSENNLKGIKLIESLTNKNYSDSILILEFASHYYNSNDVNFTFDTKLKAVNFFPESISKNDFQICNYFLVELFQFQIARLKPNAELFGIGVKFDSIYSQHYKNNSFEKGKLDLFKREFSKFKNVHFHYLALEAYSSGNIDTVKVMTYFRRVIDSECNGDSVLLRNIGDALILYSVIDYNEEYLNKGLSILNKYNDDLSKTMILEGLLSKMNLYNYDAEELSSLFDIVDKKFHLIINLTANDYQKYYGALMYYLVNLIQSENYESIDSLSLKIFNQNDTLAFPV